MQEHLTVDERAAVAKVKFITDGILSNQTSEQSITLFFNYLVQTLQHQAGNRLMQLNGQYVEVVKDEPATPTETADANEETKPD